MAYGHELFIGFRGKEKIDEIAERLGIKINFGPLSVDGPPEFDPQSALDEINNKLEKVWHTAITGLGIEVLRPADTHSRYLNYFVVRTPTGLREMSPWHLGFDYDPHEMGDSPEDAIFGVSLISRYRPTFLDWDERHGGSGGIISINSTTIVNIAIARKNIEIVLPSFATADVHIKELHY